VQAVLAESQTEYARSLALYQEASIRLEGGDPEGYPRQRRVSKWLQQFNEPVRADSWTSAMAASISHGSVAL